MRSKTWLVSWINRVLTYSYSVWSQSLPGYLLVLWYAALYCQHLLLRQLLRKFRYFFKNIACFYTYTIVSTSEVVDVNNFCNLTFPLSIPMQRYICSWGLANESAILVESRSLFWHWKLLREIEEFHCDQPKFKNRHMLNDWLHIAVKFYELPLLWRGCSLFSLRCPFYASTRAKIFEFLWHWYLWHKTVLLLYSALLKPSPPYMLTFVCIWVIRFG